MSVWGGGCGGGGEAGDAILPTARPSHGSCSSSVQTRTWVAMPTGQVLVWHLRIMMHPSVISGAVAKPNSSAPSRAATAMSRPVFIWPSACERAHGRGAMVRRTTTCLAQDLLLTRRDAGAPAARCARAGRWPPAFGVPRPGPAPKAAQRSAKRWRCCVACTTPNPYAACTSARSLHAQAGPCTLPHLDGRPLGSASAAVVAADQHVVGVA